MQTDQPINPITPEAKLVVAQRLLDEVVIWLPMGKTSREGISDDVVDDLITRIITFQTRGISGEVRIHLMPYSPNLTPEQLKKLHDVIADEVLEFILNESWEDTTDQVLDNHPDIRDLAPNDPDDEDMIDDQFYKWLAAKVELVADRMCDLIQTQLYKETLTNERPHSPLHPHPHYPTSDPLSFAPTLDELNQQLTRRVNQLFESLSVQSSINLEFLRRMDALSERITILAIQVRRLESQQLAK